MLDLGQYQINGSTAREIAASAETAIRDGQLFTGTQLPTVRALSEQLGMSPATINAAYRLLRERGLVVADGRRGTRVAARPAVRFPARPPEDRPITPGLRDLGVGLPNPELLLPMAPALARVDLERSSPLDGLEFADPDLLAFAREWFAADGIDGGAIAVVSGALDGVERLLTAHLRVGDRVLIEDPAYPPIRDILMLLGLTAVPVAVDQRGMRPAALKDGLARGAHALLAVPRAQNPTGAALDAERAAELQRILAPHPRLLVIEDDHTSEVSGVPAHTTVGPAAERWAVIRSMSKILHPDLRVAVVAGDPETVGRVEGRQALGPRWVSHLLQAVAATMLRDPEFLPTCARAAAAYASSRNALIDALAEHGLEAHGRSGMNVWVPVTEEAPVVRALYEAGWLVTSGERFRIATAPGLRVTVTTLGADEAPELARTLAPAAQAGRPRRAY